MLRKLAAAVIAVSLIAGPALAQGTASTPTSQRADVTTTGVKKVAHVKKHRAKLVKHVKRVKHVKSVKHVKQLKHVKHIKHLAKKKIAS